MTDPQNLYKPDSIIKKFGRRLALIAYSENARYKRWQNRHVVDPVDLRKRLGVLPDHPLFTFIIGCEADQFTELKSTIECLENQPYTNWTAVILAASASEYDIDQTKPIKWIRLDQAEDAVHRSKGDYLFFLSPGDTIASHALVSIAEAIVVNKRPDLVFSDEDTLGHGGKHLNPIFKPDWSPDLLLSQFYLGNLTAFRKKAVDACGKIDWAGGKAAAHDLALRLTDKSSRIIHVPDVLFHRHSSGRSSPDSDSTAEVLRWAITRRKIPIKVTEDEQYPGLFIPHWIPRDNPFVSIIILNKDKAGYLAACLKSIFMLTSYPNFEVLLVDNDSQSQKIRRLYQQWLHKEPDRFRVIDNKAPFNFSRFNNLASHETQGKILLFLNNDTRLLSPDWLEEMAGQAVRPEIGAVGCLLQFPNRTVQHAGIILSAPMVALHANYRMPVSAKGQLGRLRVPSECSMVTGACLMIRKELFLKMGGFDEELKVAYNDIDLCLRLIKAGYRNLILPQVRLIHHESITRGSDRYAKRQFRYEQEKAYFLSKWQPIEVDPYYNPNFDQASGNYALPL
jgi:GT2 family glycosyltransferase